MKYPTHKTVTLKDIAADTGYSITTISHALRDMPDISDATKAVVRKHARELGYIVNSSASALRSGRSNVVAIMFGQIASPQHASMIQELELEFRRHGYSSIVMSTYDDEEIEKNAIELALSKGVDGIVICPASRTDRSENLHFIRDTHIPCVVVNRFQDESDISWVGEDRFTSGLLAGNYLLQRGHRNILYMDSPRGTRSMRKREGFLKALQECGEPVRFNIIENIDSIDFPTLIMPGEKSSFTAIIANNDLLAWQVLRRLNDSGLSVPEDVSLIGFGNYQEYLPLPFSLTSVSCSKLVQARETAKILVKHIQNPEEPVSKTKLDVNVYEHGTVRCILDE